MIPELEKEFDKLFVDETLDDNQRVWGRVSNVKSFINTHFISRKDLLKTINIEYFCDNCHKPLSGKIGGNGNFYSVKGWYQSSNINGRIASWCNKKCEKNYFPNLISRKELEQMIEGIHKEHYMQWIPTEEQVGYRKCQMDILSALKKRI